MTITLPEPTISPLRDRMLIADFPIRTIDDTRRVVVSLEAMHHNGRLVAVLRRVTLTKTSIGGHDYESRAFMVTASVRITTEPLPRYSAKTMQAFFDKVVAALPAHVAGDEAAQALFTATDETDVL